MPLHVHVERRARKFVALQKPECRKMKHAVGALQRGVENIGLGNVAAGFKDLDARIAQRAGQIFVRATDEIVVDDDFADVTR